MTTIATTPDDLDYDERQFWVYRIFSEEHGLVYIGQASCVSDRIYMHLNTWTNRASEPVHWLYDFHAEQGPYRSRQEAHAVEVAAIREEAPLLNRQHNVKCFRKVAGGSWERIDGRTVPDATVAAFNPYRAQLRESA